MGKRPESGEEETPSEEELDDILEDLEDGDEETDKQNDD
jgi:hypothetical protein